MVPAVVGAEVVEQVGERVAELDHALRRQRHLAARPAARHRLRHAQEAPARVLLQVQVVPPVVLQTDHRPRRQLSSIYRGPSQCEDDSSCRREAAEVRPRGGPSSAR